MRLGKLIDEGERFINNNDEVFSGTMEESKKKWINKSITYLKEHYPESELTNDFIEESKKVHKNYGAMLSILKGLKDVEDELGTLEE